MKRVRIGLSLTAKPEQELLAFLKSLSDQIEAKVKELERQEDRPSMEKQLEALAWTMAKSGKCDFARDAPKELVAALRAQPKSSFTGSAHYFNVSTSNDTIFRFTRKSF